MKSPFAIIRKYQKTLMVALTLLAVFAFVVADSLSRSMRGRTVDDKVVVKTSAGDLKRSDLRALVQQRQLANNFIQRAAAICDIDFRQIQQMLFTHGAGEDLQKDVLFGHLLTLKADEIGVEVSDSTVQNFIRQVTQEKLTTTDFREIVSDMSVSQDVVFNALRGELRARTARELLAPRAPLAPEQYWDIYKKLQVGQVMDASPVLVEDFVKQVDDPSEADLQAWFADYKDDFAVNSRPGFSPGFKQPRKVNLQYLTLRFADVRKQVEESNAITDKEIEEYYEANKDIRYIIDETPTLDAKELFGPDGDEPKLDAPDAPKTDAPKTGAPKTDAPKTGESEKPAEGPSLKTDEADPPAATDDQSPDDQSPAADDPTPEKPADEAPATEKPADASGDDQSSLSTDGTGSTIDESATLREFVQNPPEEPAAEKSPAEEPPADEPATDAADDADAPADGDQPPKTPGDKPAEPAGPTPPAPAAEEPKNESADSDDQPAKAEGEKPAAKPGPKYQKLDDELRNEIREELLKERTRAELDRLAKQIFEKMDEFSIAHLSNLEPVELAGDDDAEIQKTQAQRQAELEKAAAAEAPLAAEELRKLGEEFHAAYAATGLVSAQELFDLSRNEDGEPSTEDSIGDARQAGGVSLPGQSRTSTIELAFNTQLLYGPNDVEGAINSDRFLFWKVEDRAAHVPATLDDVREEVTKSWKLAKAREKAEAHAKSLAEAVGKQDLSDGLPDGTPVGETLSFTWLYQPADVNPNSFSRRPPPTISEVSFVSPIAGESRVAVADETFMKTVFDELGVHDVGVASSGDLSAFYVVRIKQRDLADPDIDGDKFMKENKFTYPALRAFMSTPYDDLAVHAQQTVLYEWSEDLKKSYSVEWVNESASGSNDG